LAEVQDGVADNEAPSVAAMSSAEREVVSNTQSHLGMSGNNSLKRS
jgi:hypothetical protein